MDSNRSCPQIDWGVQLFLSDLAAGSPATPPNAQFPVRPRQWIGGASAGLTTGRVD